MSSFPAIHHVAITVTDFDASLAWYQKLFGTDPIMTGDESTYRYTLWLEPLLALHQHTAPDNGTRFSEFRPGLDHVSFGCANRAELETWEKRLDELGIAHGTIVDAPYGSGLSFRDPDNIPLEFFCLPA